MSNILNKPYQKYLSITLLGFASGLPYMLIFSTLATWLAVINIDIKIIGFFAWVGLTYSLKFLWAPVIDNFSIPVLRKYGKRKSWIILMQLFIIAGLLMLSIVNPKESLSLFAFFAFFIALCGSFNDIAVDAFRIELSRIEEQGRLAAGYQLGYRIAILLATSGALVIAARTSWEFVYQLMAFMMVFGILGCMFAQEKKNTNLVRSNLINSFINPLKDFYKRFGINALTIIFLIIATYRLTDIVTGQITNVFYVKMGFTLDEIALVVKFIALIAAILGFYIGTFILKRFNIYNALVIGAVLVMLTNIFFAYIAISEKNLLALSSIVALDSIAAGIVGTINITFLTSLVSKKYTAAQYALLTSIMTLVPKILSGFSGTVIKKFREYIHNDSFILNNILNNMQSTESNSSSVQSIVFSSVAIVERVNDNSWMLFYISTSLMTIPSILLLLYYSRKYRV
tara:strand:- start:1002 stop:2369 length:1368 start_codon:yes stop_codon:yes gene_type:complete